MSATSRLMVKDFDLFIALPENADRSFEFIGGKVVEVIASNYSSQVGAFIHIMVGAFILHHRLGFVTGADGGYMVSGERYIPDVAFVSRARQAQPSNAAYLPYAPDLAVEVLSPSNDPADMRIKVVNYLRANTTVWLVDPERQTVEVYIPVGAPRTLQTTDTLDGGTLLPGFSLPVRDIFSLGEPAE